MILDSVNCFVHHQSSCIGAIIKESYICFNLKPSGILFMKLAASLGERDGVDNIIFHFFLNGDACRNIANPEGSSPVVSGLVGSGVVAFRFCALMVLALYRQYEYSIEYCQRPQHVLIYKIKFFYDACP